MEKFFLLNKIDSHILHPITLNFLDDEITSIYIDKFYNYKINIAFSIFELLLSIFTITSSIISYYNLKSILNHLRVFLVLLLSIFLLINIVFFYATKNSLIYRNVLIYFGTSVHIFCYKLLIYVLLSISNTDYYLYFQKITALYSLFEMFIAMSFMHFINDSFIIHFITHLISNILIFFTETFLNKYIQLSFIFFICLISSILVCLASYFHEKFQKIEWFINYRRIKDIDYYAKLFLNNTFVLVSFKRNEVFNFNPSIRYIIEKSQLREDLDKLLYSRNESEKEELNDNPKIFINDGLNVIIKKLIFSKIKIRNENISNIIKEQINNLKSNEKNFSERINTFFSIIRDNKEQFINIYYLGAITFDNINKQYSVFIQVNPYNDQINYFAVALDFPIEVSQNIEILSKISILNSKITHEIKNPLAAIQTLVLEIKTFIENVGINEVINKLDSIFDYSEYMKYVTKDFEFLALKLTNLKEETNLTEVDIKQVNFELAVNFSVELIKNIWKNKNLKVLIRKEIDKGISEYIYTDEIRLKQIIINLLSNSLKFTKMGCVTLVCSNFDNDYILIMVKDTGVGMKQEQVDKLNQDETLFLKSNENNKFGSGLGLSVVKDIVKILGKDFKVESKYNKGTRISFLLNKNINKFKELSNTILKTDSIKQKNLINLIEASTAPLTTNNDSNVNLNTKNTIFPKNNNSEELTKRETFLLVKPIDNHTLQTTIQYSKKIDNNFLEISKKYINNKRRSSFNILNRARMSAFVKPFNFQLPKIPLNETFVDLSNIVEKKKIYALVVEDEQVLRNCNINIITKYFNERGIDVYIDENNDGIECIYKIYKGFTKEKKYQFIVTDEQMNTMNGNMMTNIIRALIDEKRFYPIKIYSSSGNNFIDDNFKKNYEGVFPKPLTIENVADIFKDNIDMDEM